jgi:hypothetical protein
MPDFFNIPSLLLFMPITCVDHSVTILYVLGPVWNRLKSDYGPSHQENCKKFSQIPRNIDDSFHCTRLTHCENE